MMAPSLGAPLGGLRPPTLKEAAAAWGGEVRSAMQAVIDRNGGSRSLFRGQMPRMGKRRQTAA